MANPKKVQACFHVLNIEELEEMKENMKADIRNFHYLANLFATRGKEFSRFFTLDWECWFAEKLKNLRIQYTLVVNEIKERRRKMS